ncbi:MAG: ABC transporter permease [Thaumarchaeota archaeon]|nr:ABC transporter permease [Nitrososphaerota archaeon]
MMSVLFAILFLNPNFVFTLNQTVFSYTPLILVSLAELIVMITGEIDMSAGAAVTLVNVSIVFLYTNYGIDGAALFFLALLVGLAIGAVNGALVAFLRLNSFLATIGTLSVFSGLALLIMGQPGGRVPEWISSMSQAILGIPSSLLIIVLLLVFWIVFRLSRMSSEFYGVGSNAMAAFSSGINVDKIKFYAFLMGGLAIGFSGLFITSVISSGDPLVGQPLTLPAILAALIGDASFSGGKGNTIGTISGALGLGFLRNLIFFLGIAFFHQDIFYGSIIIALLIILAYLREKRRK